MRRSQNTSILHMTLQVPELLQPNTADIYDVGRRHDRRLRVRTWQRGCERHHEPEEVLIQSEEIQQARRDSR